MPAFRCEEIRLIGTQVMEPNQKKRSVYTEHNHSEVVVAEKELKEAYSRKNSDPSQKIDYRLFGRVVQRRINKLVWGPL